MAPMGPTSPVYTSHHLDRLCCFACLRETNKQTHKYAGLSCLQHQAPFSCYTCDAECGRSTDRWLVGSERRGAAHDFAADGGAEDRDNTFDNGTDRQQRARSYCSRSLQHTHIVTGKTSTTAGGRRRDHGWPQDTSGELTIYLYKCVLLGCHVPSRPVIGWQGQRGHIATPFS